MRRGCFFNRLCFVKNIYFGENFHRNISKLYKIAEVLEVPISQILNFDASQIFNVSHNENINGFVVSENNFYHDQYKDKYIQMLEMEVERLKGG